MKIKRLFFSAGILLLFFFSLVFAQDNPQEAEYYPEQFLPEEEQALPDELQTPQMPPPGAAQQVVSSQGNKITLDIKGMDIVDVLKMLATRSGMNIVIGKNVTGRVTLFLKEVDTSDAFEIILIANDLAAEKKGQIINVMTQRDYELLYGERYKDNKQAKLVQLRFAKAADLSRALNQIKTNIGRVVVDEGSNTILLIDSPEKLKEMEEFISRTDMPLETIVFALNYAQADKLSPKIQELLTKAVGSLKIDERTNKIAVTDYPDRLEEIAKIINAFDEKPRQVRIDAQIVEISPEKDEFKMGVDWETWVEKNFRIANSLPLGGVTKLSFALATSNASVGERFDRKGVIDLLNTIGKTKILSSPTIMVLNNQEAKVLVGTKDAYITSTTSQSGTGSTVTSQTVNFVDVGIKLYVTPTITKDGFVTMKIKPEISSSKLTDLTAEGKITQVPIVTTSEAETTITLKDGTTIMIAGLKKDKKEKEVKKIPVLGDIPLLGFPFRSFSSTNTKTELVIFLTPYIVSGEEPLDYESLTKDKDIGYIQSLAYAKEKTGVPLVPRIEINVANSEDYKRLVFEKIKSSWMLSRSGAKRQKGKVELSFSVDSDGQLKDEPQVLSSSNQDLDNLAVGCVKKAAPFAPFPATLKKSQQVFRVNLAYE